MFDSTAKGVFVGLLLLFVAAGFVIAALGDLLLLTKVFIDSIICFKDFVKHEMTRKVFPIDSSYLPFI